MLLLFVCFAVVVSWLLSACAFVDCLWFIGCSVVPFTAICLSFCVSCVLLCFVFFMFVGACFLLPEPCSSGVVSGILLHVSFWFVSCGLCGVCSVLFVRCSWFVVRCLLIAMYCVYCVALCGFGVVRCSLFNARCLTFVGRCWLFVVYCLLYVVC